MVKNQEVNFPLIRNWNLEMLKEIEEDKINNLEIRKEDLEEESPEKNKEESENLMPRKRKMMEKQIGIII